MFFSGTDHLLLEMNTSVLALCNTAANDTSLCTFKCSLVPFCSAVLDLSENAEDVYEF